MARAEMGEVGAAGRAVVLRGAIASEAHLLDELCALARAGVADHGAPGERQDVRLHPADRPEVPESLEDAVPDPVLGGAVPAGAPS